MGTCPGLVLGLDNEFNGSSSISAGDPVPSLHVIPMHPPPPEANLEHKSMSRPRALLEEMLKIHYPLKKSGRAQGETKEIRAEPPINNCSKRGARSHGPSRSITTGG